MEARLELVAGETSVHRHEVDGAGSVFWMRFWLAGQSRVHRHEVGGAQWRSVVP